jgi:hypothetical protein
MSTDECAAFIQDELASMDVCAATAGPTLKPAEAVEESEDEEETQVEEAGFMPRNE